MKGIRNWFDTMRIKAQCKFNDFMTNEEGDVNVVSLVVLIGVAVVLAMFFKEEIKGLLETLINTIKGQATTAVTSE